MRLYHDSWCSDLCIRVDSLRSWVLALFKSSIYNVHSLQGCSVAHQGRGLTSKVLFQIFFNSQSNLVVCLGFKIFFACLFCFFCYCVLKVVWLQDSWTLSNLLIVAMHYTYQRISCIDAIVDCTDVHYIVHFTYTMFCCYC